MLEIVRIPQMSSAIEQSEIELMELERKCFYPKVQETWESKKKLLQSAISCFFAYIEGRIVGVRSKYFLKRKKCFPHL